MEIQRPPQAIQDSLFATHQNFSRAERMAELILHDLIGPQPTAGTEEAEDDTGGSIRYSAQRLVGRSMGIVAQLEQIRSYLTDNSVKAQLSTSGSMLGRADTSVRIG